MAPLATNQDLDPAALRRAFGVFPTGVVALAAEVDGVPVGLAASSFTSVSLDPPLVSVSVARGSRTWPDLRRAGGFGVTVLAEHHDAVCRQLSGPVEHRFDDIALTTEASGAVTLDEGLVRFRCDLYREVEAGDHVIVLLRVLSVDHGEQGDDHPLVFHRSGFGALAARTA